MLAIDNRYDEEHLDGATSFQKGEITTSTQSNPTYNSKAHREAIYHDTYHEVDQDSAEAAYRERNHEVNRRESLRSGLPKMITESR
jgi:hypothetical protein